MIMEIFMSKSLGYIVALATLKIHVENKTIGNKEFSIEEKDYNCVSLKDGSLQKFLDNSKVFLIDCQMKWDYRKEG